MIEGGEEGCIYKYVYVWRVHTDDLFDHKFKANRGT